MTRYWATVRAVCLKDLRLELRSRESITSMVFFSILVVVIFGFAFQTERIDLRTQAPGLLWIAFSFSGVIGLHRLLAMERENSAIQTLLLSPTDRSALYLGKLIAGFVLVETMAILTIPVFSMLLRVPVLACLPQLVLITSAGCLGFVEVGTLLATISSGSRLRDALLPLLLYPLWTPMVVACVEATGTVFMRRPLSEAGDWLLLILAYDVVFLVAGLLLFDKLLEE